MRVLRVFLWKEWREQRWILAGLAGGLVVAMAILAVFLPARTWRPGFTYDWVVGMCVLAALFTVGSDLLSREMRRERLQFLERAPAGLPMAFAAKLIFFVAVMAGAAAFGIALAAGVAWVRTGALPAGFFEKLDETAAPMLVAGILWVFAVSAWVRTNAMALPSAVLLLAVFLLPWWFVITTFQGFDPGELYLFVLLGVVGAVVTAWWSFVKGVARARPRRVVVLGGLLVAAISFLPSWALAAVRTHEWSRLEYRLGSSYLGTGGRYAWMNVQRQRVRSPLGDGTWTGSRSTALRLDLETGEWSRLGTVEESSVMADFDWSWTYRRLLGPGACSLLSLHDQSTDETIRFDGRTGERIHPGTSPGAPELEVEPADFGLEEFPPLTRSRWSIDRLGIGYRLIWRRREEASSRVLYYDPTRELCIDHAGLEQAAGGADLGWLCVLPGRWLAMDPEGKRRFWLDPVSGEREACDLIERHERVAAVIDDGTLLLLTGDSVCVADPESGERRPIQLPGPGGEPRAIDDLQLADQTHRPLEADSPVIVLLSFWCSCDRTTRTHRCGCPYRPALLDLAAGTIEWPSPELGLSPDVHVGPITCDGPRMIGIEDVRRLVRYDFAAATREVIFSVDQLSEE